MARLSHTPTVRGKGKGKGKHPRSRLAATAIESPVSTPASKRSKQKSSLGGKKIANILRNQRMYCNYFLSIVINLNVIPILINVHN